MIEESLYQKICKTIPIPTVDIAVFHKGRLLLIKRNKEPAKSQWWTPGGRQELGETIEAAAYRKLKEETGIDAYIFGSVGSVDTIWEERHNVTSVVLAEWKSGEVKLNADHDDFVWLGGGLPRLMQLVPLPHPALQKIYAAIVRGTEAIEYSDWRFRLESKRSVRIG